MTFPTVGTWYDYLENTTYTTTGTPQSIELLPGQFHVYVNRNVNNITVTPVSNIPWNGNELQAKLYPNPVSSDFTTEVNLPQSTNVHIDLYTTLGQYVNTLYNGFLVKGTHQLAMNKKAVLRGVYYLKITTKSATKTIQITLQ
jgi:1,4-alpha-glucan branching enzyme